MLERFAFQQLHGDERNVFEGINLVDGADVRMVERGGGTRLALKALNRLGIAGKAFRKEFQGHESAQLGVLRLVDHSHAAAAEFFHDPVVRDGSSDQVRRAHER